MRRLILASTLALAACSQPAPAGKGETNEASSQAPAAPAPSPVSQIRQGRWKQVMTVMGQQTTQYNCVTSEDLNAMASPPNSHCTSAQGFQRTPAGLVYEAECTGADGGGQIRTVVSGDMQNSYVIDSTMTGAGAGAMQIHIEGAYEGACRGDE